MILEDDRTPEQKKTHTILIGGHDPFLSGWGKALHSKSYAYWACGPVPWSQKYVDQVEKAVKQRNLKRVTVRYSGLPRKGPNDHVHIYVVDEGHPMQP